jgi:hypothetical protein
MAKKALELNPDDTFAASVLEEIKNSGKEDKGKGGFFGKWF